MSLTLASGRRIKLFLAISLLLLNSSVRADYTQLQRQYQTQLSSLTNNPFGIPISIQSGDDNHRMLGVVFGVIKQPFSAVKQALQSPQAWCDIVPQHFNVKACTFARYGHECRLSFYNGRKYYEKTENTHKLTYRFDVYSSEADYFQTRLTADKGPFGTRHYLIEVEAIPLAGQRTFLHFRYTYKYGFLVSLGMKTYLATVGSNKLGFTRSGKDIQGKPVYIKGVRGIIERNAVRYYFAIESYLATRGTPTSDRFLASSAKWFDLTERFPRQLHELDKADYLRYKRREHANQLHLQQQIRQPCQRLGPESSPNQ